MTVLLIEEVTPVRERLAEAVGELPGVSVQVQEPRRWGLEGMVRRLHPDVVLIDIHVPAGLRLLRRLHSARRGQAPLIVALATTSAIPYRVKCHEAGAAFFFDRINEQDRLMESLAGIRDELT
jgi:DNA-binding NarL/FixJ family response regulator